MKLSELVKLNKANGGHFFDRDTLKGNREKLSDYSVKDLDAGHVEVSRKRDSYTWRFSKTTGRVAHYTLLKA